MLGTHVLWYHGELCPQVTPECLLCVWPDIFQHLWVLRRPYRFRIRYRLIRGPSRWPSVGVQGHPVEQLHRRGTPDRSSLRCYFEREEKRGERSEKTAKTGEGVRDKEPRETRRISHFICEQYVWPCRLLEAGTQGGGTETENKVLPIRRGALNYSLNTNT